jgi:transposase
MWRAASDHSRMPTRIFVVNRNFPGETTVLSLSPAVRIFVSTKPVDMRRSFDGLFELVQSTIRQDPYSGALFLFRSRRGNVIKALWWDLDGWAIFAKRLESGTFRFPDVRFVDGTYEPVEIERADLLMLLEGIDTGSARRHKRYRKSSREAAKAPRS